MTSRPPGLVRLLRRGGIVRVREAIRDEARDAMHEGRGPLDFEALEASRAFAQVANDRDWAAQYFPSVLRARLERAAHHASGADAA